MNHHNYWHMKAVIFVLMLSVAPFVLEAPQAVEAPAHDLTIYPCHSYTEPCGKLPPPPVTAVKWSGDLGDPERGKAIAFSTQLGNCLACHEINGGDQGGTVGPSLVNFGSRCLSYDYTYQRIYDTRIYNPDAHMPLYGTNGALTDTEIRDVMAFLYSLTGNSRKE